MRKAIIALLLFVVVALPSAAFAEGFGIYEWSASGSGMGEAYMFGEEDPAVLAYNPAAITRLNGRYLSVGFSFFDPFTRTDFKGLGPLNRGQQASWENSYSPATAPYLYYVDKAGKNSWWGIALFSRFGNNIEYDRLWPGRYDTIFSGIKGFTVQPTYAWRFGDKWSAAIGLDINSVNLKMKAASPIMHPLAGYLGDVNSAVEGTSYAVGGLLAINYDFNQNTSAGLVYRTRIKHDMDADADFSSSIPTANFSTKAHGTVTLPDSLTFGISHKFNEGRTRAEFNAVWTNWTTYDSLNLTFDPNPLIQQKNAVKDWEAAWRFNLGIEHKLSSKWSILLGYVFDQSPVPDHRMDFTVPTGDRHRGSIGFKYRPDDKQEWSFAYTAIIPAERTVDSHIGGADFASATTYDGLTQVVALGYTIKLK